eukprot:5586289-Pyramimonas_sp.AAC.1
MSFWFTPLTEAAFISVVWCGVVWCGVVWEVINAIANDGGIIRLGNNGTGDDGHSISLRRIINTLFTSNLSDLVHHRVAVLDEHGTVKYMVSQSDVVRFIVKTEETYGTLGDLSIADLKLGSNT